jgi:hypothetical protein
VAKELAPGTKSLSAATPVRKLSIDAAVGLT